MNQQDNNLENINQDKNISDIPEGQAPKDKPTEQANGVNPEGQANGVNQEGKPQKGPERQAYGVKKKIIKGIIEWIIYILIFFLIVWGTPKALVKILNTDYPIASVTSSSMWPTLKRGDLIFIKGVDDPSTVQVGDIVVYTNEKDLFTIHRVTELRDVSLVTKGDANNISDKPVSYDDVIGRLVKIGNWNGRIPKLGLLSVAFSKKP